MANKQVAQKDDPYFIGLDSQDPSKVIISSAFKSGSVDVDDATLHYVAGGSGKTIILLHGFSEDWYEFSTIMPLLAKKYQVIAVDLRGIGESKAKTEKFDAETQAKDLNQLIKKLGIKNPYIAGHDMGGMIAYAYARLYKDETLGIALLDAPLPGTPTTNIMVKIPFLWHFSFHRFPKLPEAIISGREYNYFRKAFFNRFAKNKNAITDADIRHYASAFKTPQQLKAGLGLYRTYKQNSVFMKANRDQLDVPIFLIESDFGSAEPGNTAKELRAFGCKNVTAQVVKGCGHFMPKEEPIKIADLIQNDIEKL